MTLRLLLLAASFVLGAPSAFAQDTDAGLRNEQQMNDLIAYLRRATGAK